MPIIYLTWNQAFTAAHIPGTGQKPQCQQAGLALVTCPSTQDMCPFILETCHSTQKTCPDIKETYTSSQETYPSNQETCPNTQKTCLSLRKLGLVLRTPWPGHMYVHICICRCGRSRKRSSRSTCLRDSWILVIFPLYPIRFCNKL